MSDAETLALYAAKADEYADLVDLDDPLLTRFIGKIPTGGRVLDLGCGPGFAARDMAAKGLHVDATDAVAEMVALANAHDGVTAWQASFDDLEAVDCYDGIWANFSLLHAARSDMPRHLDALKQALKSGGLFHIALKSGDGSARDKLGRRYTYYTAPELRALLVKAGFTVVDETSGSGKGLDGTVAPWIAVSAHG